MQEGKSSNVLWLSCLKVLCKEYFSHFFYTYSYLFFFFWPLILIFELATTLHTLNLQHDFYLHYMFSISRVESKPLKRQSIVADGEENKRSKRHKKVSYILLEFLNAKLNCKF